MRERTSVNHSAVRRITFRKKTMVVKKMNTTQKEEKQAEKLITCRSSVFPFVRNSPSHDPPSKRSRESKKKIRMLSLATADRNAPRLAVQQGEWDNSSTNHLHRSQSRLRCIPCGRCKAVIQHDSRAPWGVVNKLVSMHSGTQPKALDPSTSSIVSSTTPAHDTPQSMPKRNDSQREFSGPTRNTSSATAAGWERKRKTEEQRKRELEEDEFTANVTVTRVTCVGCGKQISLDKRSRYYPGLWVKHRNKCPDVERLKVRYHPQP